MLHYFLELLNTNENHSGRMGMDNKAQEDRRKFLGRAGKAAIGVPATAMLLSVTDKSAKAFIDPYEKPECCVEPPP